MQLRNSLILCLTMVVLAQPPAHAQKFKDFLRKTSKSLTGSEDDIGMGLKQALEFGIREAVDSLSQVNGYLQSPYRILVPREAQQVIDKLQYVPGFENVEEDLVRRMNAAAEYAAKEATPIFIAAITDLTIDDGMDILTGDDDAATRYLESRTRDSLYASFMPVIRNALDEVNAREYWSAAVEKYNKIPFVKRVNPELDDHVNNKALNGLFAEIEKKEEKIRGNVDQRTTELLRKVFAMQDQ